MRNLNQDVLNEERRNLFKKIISMENKLSLYNKIFLTKQNPYKFYKLMQKRLNNDIRYQINDKKSNLKLISNVKNSQFSLPIKITKNNIEEKEQKNDIFFIKSNKSRIFNKMKYDCTNHISNINNKKIKISKSCMKYPILFKNTEIKKVYDSLAFNKNFSSFNSIHEHNKVVSDVNYRQKPLLKSISLGNKISIGLQTNNFDSNKSYSFDSEVNKDYYENGETINLEEDSKNFGDKNSETEVITNNRNKFWNKKEKNYSLGSFRNVINTLPNYGKQKLLLQEFKLAKNKKIKLNNNYRQNRNFSKISIASRYNLTEIN